MIRRLVLKPLIFVHRWLGVALCLVFLLWFPSGIGMMYWTFPGVSATDRLDHSPKLDPTKIVLSPVEAAEKIGVQANPTQVRLSSFDGRPVYRFGGGGRGGRGGGQIVYADTGEEQTEVNDAMLDRIASAWAGKPIAEAKKISVEEVDQWTVAGQFRNLRPMYKYTWPDGQQVYLNGTNGEIVQYTTFWSRVAAHVSAIPHWVYYTPLRQNQPIWISFMIYGSLIGTFGAILGMVVAVWMYSPRQKYRLNAKATGIPYRGQKRWHWILGMVFGLATVTWTFSGLMSLGPFPLMQRLTGTTPRNERLPQQQQQQQAPPEAQPTQTAAAVPAAIPQRGGTPRVEAPVREGQPQVDDGQRRAGGRRGGRGGGRRGRVDNPSGEASRVENSTDGSAPATAGTTSASAPRGETQVAAVNRGGETGQGQAGRNQGGRGGGQQGLAGALRGRVRMSDFASVHPKDLLAKVPDLDVRELEWTSFASTPIFSANLPGGKNQLVSLDGTLIDGFDQQKVIDIVKGALPDAEKAEIKVIDQYDLYYFDRTRQRPLPVLLVLTHDAEKTRYYVDPKSARVLTTYNSRNWVNRYLYTGLHSLNFPFLYNYRPLWDIVVITFMLGGTALCVTSLVLTWRVLGRKLRRIPMPGDVLKADSGR